MAARSHEVTRLEGFSDAVFGFALTLLVVTLETPRSVEDLRALARGFLPFGLMFAMVCWIWYEHNVFFRRYGLQDPWTVFLNSVLLFVVLFYVYPLKFITTALFARVVGGGSPVEVFGTYEDSRLVMLLYSSGIVLIFGCFTLLYRHAWRRRDALALDERSVLALTYGTRSHLISMSIGVASIAIVLVGGGPAAPLAGLIYFLMGPLHGWNGYAGGRAQDRLKRSLATTDPAR